MADSKTDFQPNESRLSGAIELYVHLLKKNIIIIIIVIVIIIVF